MIQSTSQNYDEKKSLIMQNKWLRTWICWLKGFFKKWLWLQNHWLWNHWSQNHQSVTKHCAVTEIWQCSTTSTTNHLISINEIIHLIACCLHCCLEYYGASSIPGRGVVISVTLMKVVFVESVKAADSVASGPMALCARPGSLMNQVVCTVKFQADNKLIFLFKFIDFL